MPQLIECALSKKQFKVKKVCKIAEMPKSCRYFWTCYLSKKFQDIYISDNGIMYATPERN